MKILLCYCLSLSPFILSSCYNYTSRKAEYLNIYVSPQGNYTFGNRNYRIDSDEHGDCVYKFHDAYNRLTSEVIPINNNFSPVNILRHIEKYKYLYDNSELVTSKANVKNVTLVITTSLTPKVIKLNFKYDVNTEVIPKQSHDYLHSLFSTLSNGLPNDCKIIQHEIDKNEILNLMKILSQNPNLNNETIANDQDPGPGQIRDQGPGPGQIHK